MYDRTKENESSKIKKSLKIEFIMKFKKGVLHVGRWV